MINEELIEKLKSINPIFQITLDGNKSKHDKVRIGKENNMPTYDKIIKSLHLISEHIPSHIEDALVTLRINYDNQTLKQIDDLINDIKDLDTSKFLIHLERVWQTMESSEDKEQKQLLFDTLRKLISEGFEINTGNMKSRRYACPAEDFSFAIINYDGLVYRCNGRTLEKGKHEGVLTEEGIIEWNDTLLSRRLGRTTFENPMCLSCKMLPVCMGPCSQKCMENNWENMDKVCSLKNLGVSIDQYLTLWAEQLYVGLKYKKTMDL